VASAVQFPWPKLCSLLGFWGFHKVHNISPHIFSQVKNQLKSCDVTDCDNNRMFLLDANSNFDNSIVTYNTTLHCSCC